MRIEELLHTAMVRTTPGWVAPDVLIDDLRAWADRGHTLGLSKRTIRDMRRIAGEIERLDTP